MAKIKLELTPAELKALMELIDTHHSMFEENEIETDTDETYQIIPAFFLGHLLHFGNSSKNKICPLLVNQLLKSISKQSLLCIYRI